MGRQRPEEREPVPAEEILGWGDPEGGNGATAHPAALQQALEPQSRRSAPGDRAIIAGVIALFVLGVAAYVFREEIAEQYQPRVHPERYWSAQVQSRRFSIAVGELEHQECMLDLQAARMKEPIRVAREELFGVSSSAARAGAAEATATQEALCDTIANGLRADQERLAAAGRELERAGQRK